MHRLIVALLAVIDAAVAAAVGIVAPLAVLTLVWVLGFGGGADWGSLWPAGATIWQFGHFVPLSITLPGEYLAAAGIDLEAASFTLSLAPLAFASFTAIFAARSGVRASRAEAWVTGVLTGSAVFAAIAVAVALTSRNGIAAIHLWQAVLFPSAVFAASALVGALVTEWREAGQGAIAGLRDRVEEARDGWGEVPALVARGSAVVLVGLVGLGAIVAAVAIFARAGEIIALFEAAHVDALGATVITLGQLVYLPTLVVWAISFIAGPGFSLGQGATVSPAGTEVGVIPGIPLLGAIPESSTPWLLLLALLPVAMGGVAGWIARSRLVAHDDAPGPASTRSALQAAAPDLGRTAALAGLLAASDAERAERVATTPVDRIDETLLADAGGGDLHRDDHDPIGARLVTAGGIAIVSAAGAALLAWSASGALGPGSLADVGPSPGPVALAVGLEVLLGAGILLLSPRRRGGRARADRSEPVEPEVLEPAVDQPSRPLLPASGSSGTDADAP
ncbi:MAG: DUF6350 family protein [Microbacterium sp.]